MRQLIELDAEAIEAHVNHAITLIGSTWVRRRRVADEAKRSEARAANHRRRLVRYQPAHELIQWLVAYDDWKREYSNANAGATRPVLMLASFAGHLWAVRACKGIEHVIARLKLPAEFAAASFEVEVAAAYAATGWSVEFVETGMHKSPDLRVELADGRGFWVECKRRDDISGRDAAVQTFWTNLKEALYREWGPAKTSVALSLRSRSDPVVADAPELRAAILQAGDRLLKMERRGDVRVLDRCGAGKFEFELRLLAEPDSPIPFKGVQGAEGVVWDLSGVVAGTSAEGVPLISNPVFFAYKNSLPSDRYAGALNSFRAAADQLPPEGPGVVWIRVPRPAGRAQAEADLQALVQALRAELRGDKNTRVTSIVLSTRVFADEVVDGRKLFKYAQAAMTIEHERPRSPLPPTPPRT